VNDRSELGPRRFAVTSEGASATRWLAFALASHPRVFVAHGHFAIDSIVGGEFRREGSQGDAAALALGNAARAIYEASDIDEVFAAYRSVSPDAQAYGNVHSYTLEALLPRLEGRSDAGAIAVANLVRHPVSYIESHFSLVRKAEGHPGLYRGYAFDLFPRALQEYRELYLVDCPDFREFLAFAASCFSVLNVARALGYEQFRHFRMETLTTDGGALRTFCETVTGLEYDANKLDEIVAAGPINRHRKTPTRADPLEIYRGWPAWKRDVVATIVSGQALANFERVGYAVDMLRDGSYETERDRPRVPCLADALKIMDEDHPFLEGLGRESRQNTVSKATLEPKLLESVAGYNIVQLGREFIVLKQSIGPVDVADGPEILIERHGRDNVGVLDTLESAQTWIRARTA
jgi:hypothetical protein